MAVKRTLAHVRAMPNIFSILFVNNKIIDPSVSQHCREFGNSFLLLSPIASAIDTVHDGPLESNGRAMG